MKRRKDNRCTRFHEVWYNKQGTWILYHISCATPFERRCFPPLRGHIPFHSQKAKRVRMCCHQTICFGKGVRVLRIHTTHCDCCHASSANSATKDLNYRVEGKRPFTEPTKATPVEQRCQVFLEEFLDCNSWTAWSLLLKISPCSPPWSSRKVVKWCKMLLFLIHFLCAKRYSACSVQTKQTASLRCAQYKGVALLTGYSKMQLAHRFDEAVAKCQAGKASELQVPSLSLAFCGIILSNSNHCNWLSQWSWYLQHSSTGFMTSWICSGSFKVFNSHPMIQVSQRSARSCPMILSRSVVSCAAHVEMHPSSKTLKKLRCITQALVNACCVGEPFDLLVHVPRIAVTLFSNPVKIPGMLWAGKTKEVEPAKTEVAVGLDPTTMFPAERSQWERQFQRALKSSPKNSLKATNCSLEPGTIPAHVP